MFIISGLFAFFWMWFNDWVEVKKNANELFLYLSFRNDDLVLGPVLTPYPATIQTRTYHRVSSSPVLSGEGRVFHTYPTRSLGFGEAKALSGRLIELLGKDHVRFYENPYNVVQVRDVHHVEFLALDKCLTKHFLPGLYTKQARWQLEWPHRRVDVDPVLVEVAARSRIFSEQYHDVFMDRRRKQCPELKEINRESADLSSLLKRLDGENEVVVDRNGVSLYLHSLKGIWFRSDVLSPQDIENLPWCFIDTEKKFFAYYYGANCHIALLFKDCEGALTGEIHTTERAEVDGVEAIVNGTNAFFSLSYYPTETEMVIGACKSIRVKNPAVMCGHNIPYDFGELKVGIKRRADASSIDTADTASIGLGMSEPLTRVALEFFKRMDCKGKIVIDTMRLARILEPYLPGFGLEAVAGLQKSISYQQFDSLARNGDRESSLALARYVSHDVVALYHLLFHGAWSGRLVPSWYASRIAGVSLSESTYGASCMEGLRDQLFFTMNGTYRKPPEASVILMKMKKEFKKEWPSIHNHHFDPLFSGVCGGRYTGVIRCYVPLELDLVKKIILSVPEALPLTFMGRFKNPLDQVAACQYLTMLTQEPWLHWFYIRRHEKKTQEFLKESGISLEQLRALPENFWKEYRSNCFTNPSANRDLILKQFGSSVVGWLSRKALDEKLHCRLAQKRFLARHECTVDRFEATAESYAKFLSEVIKKSQVQLIHRQGQWLYMQGSLPVEAAKLVISIDELTLLKVYHKGDNRVIFKERGLYHGIRLKPKKPSNITPFESQTIAAIIDALLEDSQEKIKGIVDEGISHLEEGIVPRQDLLFSLPGLPLGFQGFAKSKREVFFTYAERDAGLNNFRPDLEFYLNRFKRIVGGWLEVPRTWRLPT